MAKRIRVPKLSVTCPEREGNEEEFTVELFMDV